MTKHLKINILFLSLLLLTMGAKISDGENHMIIFRFYDVSGKVITKGNVYFLSNDLQVNDISLGELKRLEKLGIGKLTSKGMYAISKGILNRDYNKSNKDSLSAFFRCDDGYGEFFKFKISDDTAHIYGLQACDKPK